MDDKKKKRKKVNETTVGMAQSELVQRYGEASSQIIQSYKGVRYNSAGKEEAYKGRNLKDISDYKINPDYEAQNIKQQSGFSAELIKEARDNKKAIISGDSTRTSTTDGLGLGNHQQYDHVKVDLDGNVVEGSGSQMKFYGTDKKGNIKVVDKIANDPQWERYDGYIDIPEDQYEEAIKYADKKAVELKEQARKLREKGNIDKAREIENKADKYKDSKKKIRKSGVKEGEAIEARINPEKFVTKELIKDSHNAGKDAAKGALILSGSISCAQNLYLVLNGDKSVEDATLDVVETTAKSGAMAYGVGVTGTGLKSIMHSSKNEMVRKIGNTNVPAMIATATVEVSKSIKRYADGEIDELELLEELGEKGTGMVAAGMGTAMGSIAGTLILPGVGTVVGGFLGSMIGYTISGILYNESVETLRRLKISEERRRIIEELSKNSIKEMQRYQKALTEYANREFQRSEEALNRLFSSIYDSILNNDIGLFFNSIDLIGKEFGFDLEINTFEEFDELMNDEDFILTL